MYAINPLAVAHYRDRHHVSGAKSDASDAKLLADLVRTDRHNHRPIAGDSPDAEAIKVLARAHQNLIWTLCGRRLLAAPMGDHPDAELAGDAIKMAAAARGGRAVIDEVIFHTDRGSTYTAGDFTKLCRKLGIRQSMGRVGSCFDNAASRRSSPPSNTRCCPGIGSPPRPRHERL